MSRKYFRLVNTFFVVVPMTLIMAFVGMARNYGFKEGWLIYMLRTWMVMAPVAYVAAFLIIPQAVKLTNKLVKDK
jgi:Protein of unknown function (DUF2798).